MHWQDIYEPEQEERDDPTCCEWCLEYFYDDEMSTVSEEDDDGEVWDIHVCKECKKIHLAEKK